MNYAGIPIVVSELVPKGKVMVFDRALVDMRVEQRLAMKIGSPTSHMIMTNVSDYAAIKPTPLWTRHMAGVREAERDRRRRRRGLA